MKFAMMSSVFTAREYSVAQTLKACQELDLKYIDWITTMDLPAAELRKMTEDAGVSICAYTMLLQTFPAGKTRMEALKRELENAVALGVSVTMLPTWPAPEHSREVAFEEWLPVIREYAKSAVSLGLIPTIENFPRHNSPMVTVADFRRFQKECPQLKLTFDDGNCAGGENEVDALEAVFDDIAHVHLKDFCFYGSPVRERGNCIPTLDGRWMSPAVIGAGDVRTAECLAVLKKKNYQGFINLEYEGREFEPLDGLRMAIDNLRQMTV